MLQLSELNTTQSDLRLESNLDEMIDFVKSGGHWTQESLRKYAKSTDYRYKSPRVIQISLFEDGKKFIHDGHHRSVATYLGGRDYLLDEEYSIVNWLYQEYLDNSPDAHSNGWYTPFDPRTHVRIPDISDYKKIASEQDDLVKWIDENMHLYSIPRPDGCLTVVDLAKIIKLGSR